MSEYYYDKGDPLEQRHSYTYVPYRGRSFLVVWLESRFAVWRQLPPSIDPPPAAISESPKPGNAFDLHNVIEPVFATLSTDDLDGQDRYWLDWLIRRFEISKRLHGRYNATGQPVDSGDYRDLERYVRLAELMVIAFARNRYLPALNVLLKCLDTLSVLWQELTPKQKGRLARLIEQENRSVQQLCELAGNNELAVMVESASAKEKS